MSLTSLRDYTAGSVIDADVCIVGAGPAGIAIARELAMHGVEVCLVESGGLEPDRRTQELAAGDVSGMRAFSLAATRDRVFGGTSHSWAGYCATLRASDFEPRSWVPHSGWPISLSDLQPYYRRARSLCDLAGESCDTTNGNTSAALDARKLEYVVWERSPPTRFGVKYRSELEQAAGIRILLHANVTRLLTTANDAAVTGVEIATFEGRTATVRAAVVVLAAGGVENARLLLLSGAESGGGLGNSRDLVGRFFMEHVYLDAGALTPGADLAWLDSADPNRMIGQRRGGIGIATSPQAQAERGLLGGYVALRRGIPDTHAGYVALARLRRALAGTMIAGNALHDLRDVVTDLGDVTKGIYAKLSAGLYTQPYVDRHRFAIQVHIEQAPDAQNRIKLGRAVDPLGRRRAHLFWRLGELERRSVHGLLSLLGEEATRLGLGSVRIAGHINDGPSLWSGLEVKRHHMGTTRMGDNRERGVVDADCGVYGVDNLYVAGSSVFPTGGHANPTLTILALALRLADHLRTRVGKGR